VSSSANTRQVGGKHYSSQYQHWDFAHDAFGDGYFQGQITKYVFRWKKKNGLEDLNKAAHFLQKLIELRDGLGVAGLLVQLLVQAFYTLSGQRALARKLVQQLIKANDVGIAESLVMQYVADGRRDSLARAARILGHLIYSLSEDACGACGASARYVDQDGGPP